MGISGALNAAISGLNVAQRGLDVVADNIANVNTDGFTRRELSQSETTLDNRTTGVQIDGVNRVLDQQAQSQLRSLAGVNVNNQISADFFGRLDTAFGEPGSPTALDATFNTALSSLEILSTSPNDFAAQVQAVTDLQVFTGQLNSISDTVQGLRQEADAAIAGLVDQANAALQGIEDINSRILTADPVQGDLAAFLDERDRLIDELSQIVDVQVTNLPNNTVQIRTGSGITLFDQQANQLTFDQAGTVSPATTVENGFLSTISVTAPGGAFSIDLLQNNGIQQGALAAYTDLRDTALVQVQSQLDAFAAQISLAVSNADVPSTPITNGLAVETGDVLPGNTVSLNFTDTAGVAQSVTLVQVSDPAALPVAQTFTADPNDIVIGIDFSSPTAATDLQTALNNLAPGNGVTVGNTGTSFEFTATTPASVDALSANVTNQSFTNGLSFALFQDGGTGTSFTNALGNDAGLGLAGFAQRIEISEEVISDPSLLARFTTSTSNAGDSSRVDLILDRIREDVVTFSPATGLGSAANPLQVTAGDFLQTVITSQGQRAETFERQADASQISFNNVQARIQSESAVNIDLELAQLIELEQSYQANARILATVQELIDTLFQSV